MTICVKDMRQILAKVVNETINLSALGEIVQQVWIDLPKHYDYVDLDEAMVMPNHFHGLLWLKELPSHLKAVGAGLKPAPTKHGLSEVIRGFKTFSARKINEFRGTTGMPVWQRGYYEHVIRDDTDLENHREYIISNPLKWALDEYYS